MPDLLELDSDVVTACLRKFGSYTIEQDAPHKLSIKSGSTSVLDVQTPQGKKWTVYVAVNIIEEDV